MDHQLAGPCLLHRVGDFKAPFAAIPAETHLEVNGSGGGATLLKDPELIYRGAKAMREAVPADLPAAGTASRMAFAPR
jgi:hypothetical protein